MDRMDKNKDLRLMKGVQDYIRSLRKLISNAQPCASQKGARSGILDSYSSLVLNPDLRNLTDSYSCFIKICFE